MSQKIILFLSNLRPGAEKSEYLCPDGSFVSGTQTNEAPVLFLLRTHPDISEILSIVTRESVQSAWDQFCAVVHAEYPSIRLTQIPFMAGQDFTFGPMREIMGRVNENDEIFLETTGGFRNDIMHLLLLSRVLSYTKVQTVGAVYSNFQEKEIQDVSHLIGLFDLVGGMQELTSFGSVRTLRTYYGKPAKDVRIERLLFSVEKLTETISLCRTKQIDKRMADFDEALTAAESCSDPLMQQLLPAFRMKFGKKLTIPGLIKWCVQSDMLQQALTIYKERIPTYLLKDRSDLITVSSSAPPPNVDKDYQSEDEARFYEHFLKMGRNMRSAYYRGRDPDDRWNNSTIKTIEYMEDLLPNSYFHAHCSVNQLCVIAMDYLYIRALRNMTNHANDQATESQKEIEEYLAEHGYQKLDSVTAQDAAKTILNALDHLKKGTVK